MKYKKYLRKPTKMFDYKLIVIALIMSLTITTVLANGGLDLQSEFLVDEATASFEFVGISYEGGKYLSKSSFISANPGAQVFDWKSDKISFDIDGPITFDPLSSGTLKVDLGATRTLDMFGGLKPDTTFEILETPYLVGLDLNPLSYGYTDLIKRADGSNQYMYWYKSSVSISTYMSVLSHEECVEMGISKNANPSPFYSETSYFDLEYDGVDRPLSTMAEIEIIRNLNSLLSVDLPEMEGYTLGWELHISGTDAKMVWSEDGTVYDEFTYQSVIEEYPEGDISLYVDGQFHFNYNDNIQRSNSVGDKLVPVDDSGVETVSVGLTQTLIPGHAKTITPLFWGVPIGVFTYWFNFASTIEYDVIIKIAVVDTVIPDDSDGNTTTTTPPTPPPFTWDPIDIDLDTVQLVAIGGVIFIMVITVGFYITKKQESVYY